MDMVLRPRPPDHGLGGLLSELPRGWASYAGMTMEANAANPPTNDRMPVLLKPHEHALWLHGSFDDILGFQARCFPDDLIVIERTGEPWVKRKGAVEQAALF